MSLCNLLPNLAAILFHTLKKKKKKAKNKQAKNDPPKPLVISPKQCSHRLHIRTYWES